MHPSISAVVTRSSQASDQTHLCIQGSDCCSRSQQDTRNRVRWIDQCTACWLHMDQCDMRCLMHRDRTAHPQHAQTRACLLWIAFKANVAHTVSTAAWGTVVLAVSLCTALTHHTSVNLSAASHWVALVPSVARAGALERRRSVVRARGVGTARLCQTRIDV